MERRLAAILAADVVGYSRLMGADEAGTLERLKALRRELVQPKITERGGRVVKFMGDGLLAEFPSVVEAVLCAVDIQESMIEREADSPDERRIALRIGINLGDIMVEGSDIYGDGVNVAARLEALAEPGGICLSGDACRQVRGKIEAEFEDLGEREVKNIREPVRVWRWSGGDSSRDSSEPVSPADPTPESVPVIAVLPFDKLGRDEAVDEIADGLTDAVITAFSRQTGMSVLARSSTLQFKGKAVDVTEIGRKLGANYVLLGSVRKAGDRVRVTAQLVEADRGNHLWGDQLDGTLTDVFTLQDDVTFNIVSATRTRIHMKDAERVRDVPEGQLTDNELLALASQRMQAVDEEDQREAARLLELVVERSPRNPMALAMLASCALLENEYGYRAVSEQEASRALDLIDRSVRLNGESDYAHFVRGRLLLQIRHEHSLAIAEAERALELNPNYPYGYVLLGYATLCRGEPERGMALIDKAIRADHRHARFAYFEYLAIGNFLLGDDAAALDLAETAAQRAGYLPYLRILLAIFHAALGQSEKARAQIEALLEVAPDATIETIRRPPFKEQADLDKFLNGLRKAGLPEGGDAPFSDGLLPLPDKPSIAVLPFTNMSGDPEQEYFSDGITEDIITELSRFSSLFVIARNSSFAFKGQAVDVRRIARELGVRYVLEGSIRRAGGRVRITAQLIDSPSANHIWAERYDREMEDIFDLQEEITRNVVTSLAPQIEMAEIERARGEESRNLSAYDLALKAKAILFDGIKSSSPDVTEQAIEAAEEALAIDPRNVEALWTQGFAYHMLLTWGSSPDPEALTDRAWAVVKHLSEIDATNPYGCMISGAICWDRGEYDQGIAHMRRGYELNPNFAWNLISLAWCESLAGLTDEAREHAELGLRLSPRDMDFWIGTAYLALAQAHLADRNFEKAMETGKRALELKTSAFRLSIVAASCALLGEAGEAARRLGELKSFAPEFLASLLDGSYTPYSIPEYNALLVEGLRKAAPPEGKDDPSPEVPLLLPDKPSIAVLPFANLSDDSSQEFFVDGMTEDLITDLAKIESLFVIARNTVFTYKDKSVVAPNVARELGVRYVLEGSVRRDGDRVRINTQLIDGISGARIWAERYDGSLADIFALQDKVTGEIIAALKITLTPDEWERQARKGTDNPHAHDAYLRGWQFYRRYTPEDFVKAIPHFKRAVDLDPDFGQAWAALASVYWISYRKSFAWTLIVNPNRDNVVSWLGTHQKAEQFLEQAKRNPTPLAHQIESQMSWNFRQFDKAISEAERAVELDPNDPEGHLAMAWALIFAGRPEAAIASAEKGVQLDPYFPARYLFALGTAQLMLDRHTESETTLNRALELSPENMEILAPLAVGYARLGRQEEAKAALQKYTDFWILYAPRIETHMEWWPFKREADIRRFGEGLVEAGLCCEDRLEAYIGRVRQGGTLE